MKSVVTSWKGLIPLFFILMLILDGNAQTCCSGGVPLSSNLGLPPAQKQTLQFTLSYDLNVLNTLKFESDVLDDDSRIRRTHSVLFEIGYSFTTRFSVDAFFSWVRQVRVINQFGNTDFTATQGIGDAVFLFKYRLWDSPDQRTIVTSAIGVKAPVGASNLTRNDGRPIIADLQPGSGAWDGIAWAQIVHVAGFRPTMGFIGTFSYSFKGKNSTYLGSETYQFGNELQLIGGLSDRFLLGNLMLDPTLVLRYRNQSRDRINDITFPNTGGNWIFINPGVQLWINPQWSIQANAELPLWAKVTGTQLSPTFRINTGLYYSLSFGEKTQINTFQP